MGKKMTKKWGKKLYAAGPKWGKIMGKRSKQAIFPHYWNGEKEWGKNINNGEKLLMKMGKILVWIPIPMIELSRIKKDKRVFGVMGDNRRNNSRPERLIVNSLGEGGIWVCNSNGNIENGDYITSSDYLGYGEKQDEIFLCNYTVAKRP